MVFNKNMNKKNKTTTKKITKKPREKAFPKFEMFKKILFNNPGITPTQAVIDAGYRVKNRYNASAIASVNLRKLKISMPEVLERVGLTDEQDALDLKALRDADKTDEADHHIRFKSIELSQKIKGNLKEKVDVSANITYDRMIQEAITKSQNVKED